MKVILKNLFNSKISFKRQSTFNDKYKPFKIDITDHILHTQKPDIEGIKGIVQKYSPDTDVVDITKTNPRYCASIAYHAALIPQPDKTYRHVIKKKTMNISPSLRIYRPMLPNNLNNRAELINSLLHEGTHLFQGESCDRISDSAIINSYLIKEKNMQRAKNTIMAARYLSKYLRDNCQATAAQNKTEAPVAEVVPDSFLDVNKSFMNLFQIPAKIFIQNEIFKFFRKSPKNSIDRKFIVEYIKWEAQRELEAYTNGTNSTKELLNLNGHIDRELFANVAKVIYDACDDLLKRNVFKD